MLFKTLELFVRKVNFIVVYVVADVIFNKITFKLACSGRLDMPPNSSQDKLLYFSETEQDDIELSKQALNFP